MKLNATAYLVLAVIGTIVPYTIFGVFVAEHGLDLAKAGEDVFASTIAIMTLGDLLVSSIVFLYWSSREAPKLGVRWWPFLAANLLVGLSLALPAFLYVRERKRSEAGEPARVAPAV